MIQFERVFEHYIKAYCKEFGENKFRTINNKISTSNKVSKLLEKSKNYKIAPTAKDYINTLHEITYFIFSAGETVSSGALLSLYRWHKEVNSYLCLLNDFELITIAKHIIIESNSMFLSNFTYTDLPSTKYSDLFSEEERISLLWFLVQLCDNDEEKLDMQDQDQMYLDQISNKLQIKANYKKIWEMPEEVVGFTKSTIMNFNLKQKKVMDAITWGFFYYTNRTDIDEYSEVLELLNYSNLSQSDAIEIVNNL